MEQVARIEKMEQFLNKSTDIIQQFSEVLEQFLQCQEGIEQLKQYYGSKEWYEDLEAYDNRQLPQGLRCGVLSEDLIYDMLMEYHKLAIQMLEIGTGIVKRY